MCIRDRGRGHVVQRGGQEERQHPGQHEQRAKPQTQTDQLGAQHFEGAAFLHGVDAVSYTHLDVYKRQDLSSCSSDAVQSLIGSNIASVDTRPLAKTVRIIPPNSAVTMDYNPQRLNIETDARGVIVRMTCG